MNLNSPALGTDMLRTVTELGIKCTAVNVQETNASGNVFRLDNENMTHARKKI